MLRVKNNKGLDAKLYKVLLRQNKIRKNTKIRQFYFFDLNGRIKFSDEYKDWVNPTIELYERFNLINLKYGKRNNKV